MHGWVTVTLVAAAQLAGAIVLMRGSRRRWRDYLAVAVLTLLLIRPVLKTITGDVSHYLPGWAFANGADGKDQIIVASALSTLLLPLLIAAAVVWGAGRAWRRESKL
jgi:hypothetical protein